MDKKESFTVAIKNNEGIIYKIAALYTNHSEDRDDLVQEIIYQLWKSFGSFNHQSGLSTWLYRVAMNVAIYHLKTTKKRVSTVPLGSDMLNLHETEDTEMEEKWELIKHQLNNLNLLDKGIILLYLENKSYEEIAEIIGISETNVGTKLSRIKKKLKRRINKKQ